MKSSITFLLILNLFFNLTYAQVTFKANVSKRNDFKIFFANINTKNDGKSKELALNFLIKENLI